MTIFIQKITIALIVILLAAIGAPAQKITLPEDFDWKKIPAGYAGKTLKIKHHYNAHNINIILPDNITLLFIGGSLTNFSNLQANNTTINAEKIKIFDAGSTFSGTFINTVAAPEWFGAKGNNDANDSKAVETAIRYFGKVTFAGSYYIPGINITIDNPVELVGEAGAMVRGDGGNVGRFTVANSISVSNIHFTGFRFCFWFNHHDIIRDVRFSNNTFSNIENPIYTPNNNFEQKLFNVTVTNNTFNRCTAGVELFCYLRNVEISNNNFLDLGSPLLQKQSNAIRLGNSWFDYHTDKEIGDFRIFNNRIMNVFCGQYMKGREGYECHGILVIGNRVEINGNHIENVYNGGVAGNPRIKTGSEGIYVKANDCRIYNNTLINAGFGEGAISVKGTNTGIVIEKNVLKYTEDIADHSQLITCYYAGDLIIRGNVMESNASNTTGIKLCTSDKVLSNALVSDNKSWNVKGYGFKILNRFAGNEISIINNVNMDIDGEILKEESTQNYSLIFSENNLRLKNGVFMPSSRSNDLTFSGNSVSAMENTKINNLQNKTEIDNNIFNIYSSYPNPLFIDKHKSCFTNNKVNLNGAWKMVLMISGEEPGTIAGNTFNLKAGTGNIERVIFINTPTPGVAVALENNTFSGSESQKNAVMVCVANAGLHILTLDNNSADKNTGVFLDVISTVRYACFVNNQTKCTEGFLTERSLRFIEEYYSCSNSQLSDNE